MKRVPVGDAVHYLCNEFPIEDGREFKERDAKYFARALYKTVTNNIVGVGLFYEEGEDFLSEIEERQYVLVVLQMENERIQKEYDEHLENDPVISRIHLSKEYVKRAFEEADNEQRGLALTDHQDGVAIPSNIGVGIQRYKDIKFMDNEALEYAVEVDHELLRLDKAKFRKKVREHPDMGEYLTTGDVHEIEDMPATLVGAERTIIRMATARDNLMQKEYERTGELRGFSVNGLPKRVFVEKLKEEAKDNGAVVAAPEVEIDLDF